MTLNEPSCVAFLYIDENYMDAQSPSELQAVSLTGLLVRADTYPVFRDGLFRLLPGFDTGAKGFNVKVHAADLFRDLADDDHFAFYSGLVSLVNETACRAYRRGFNFKPGHKALRKAQRDMLWYCFKSMLIAVTASEDNLQVWPVVEADQSKAQDKRFAGYVRWMDHATAHLEASGEGVAELVDGHHMVDNRKVGDLHYASKRSIIASAVDCLAYLLHCKWLGDRAPELSNYKRRLADIASHLHASLLDDYVVPYRAC